MKKLPNQTRENNKFDKIIHYIPLGSNGPAPFIVLKNVANILPILPQLMSGISLTLISRFYLELHNPIYKKIFRQYIYLLLSTILYFKSTFSKKTYLCCFGNSRPSQRGSLSTRTLLMFCLKFYQS